MNGTGRADHTSREIARGLVDVLDSALAPDAPVLALSAAREVALLLDLAGLERVLAVAESLGSPRPAALEHVLDRVRRLNHDARQSESVAAMQAADSELAAHAATLAAQEWTAPAPGRAAAAVATIPLADALAGWSIRGLDPAAPPIVTAPVAAALSAACDWLGLEPSRGMDAEVHDDFVALLFDVHQPEGLAATGDVLGTIGGHLAPVGAGSHRWRLVVPRSVQRPSFLLIEQGRLGLAVPWHSVLKLRMLAAERAADEAAVLPPLRWATHGAGERPAALLAHGLKRAWFFADRVVWRFAADTEETDAVPPVAGLSLVVRGDEHALYWVVDPAWLLRTIPTDVPEWRESPEPANEGFEEPAGSAEPAAAHDGAVTSEPEAAAEPAEDVLEAEPPSVFHSPEPMRVQPRMHVEPVAPLDRADAALERLTFAPPAGPDEPAAAEESEDTGIEWLVTRGPEDAPVASAAPALTLLSSDDVEPLSDESPEPARSRFARALECAAEATAEAGAASAVEPEPLARILEVDAVIEVAPVPEEIAPVEEPAVAAAPVPAEEPPVAEAPASAEAADAAEPPATSAATSVPVTAAASPVADEPAAPPEAPAPVAESVSAAPAEPTEPPAPLEITSRLALVAEDSLVASIFLQRLLEQRGFRAVPVEMAHDLALELQRGGWGLVCVDVSLPDASGAAHLEAAVKAAREAASGVAVIALTRDGDDEKLALGAGVAHHLRKPFEAGAVDRLFVALGLAKRGGRP